MNTRTEYQIHANYGYGYEEIYAEETKAEALQRLAEYRENEPMFPYRLKIVRVKN